MSTNYSLLFYLKKPKNYVSGPKPIYMRITVNGISKEISTGRSCEPFRWNSSANRSKGTKEGSKTLNIYLDSLMNRISAIHTEMTRLGMEITSEMIKLKYLGKDVQSKTLLDVFLVHNKQMEALLGNGFKPNTLKGYTTSASHIKRYIEKQYRSKDIDIKKIDYSFVAGYEFFLRSALSCSAVSAAKYIKHLRKIVKICIAHKWMTEDPFLFYKSTAKPKEKDFLTRQEFADLEDKQFTVPRLAHIRDIFVFCCYTGLSYADVKKFTTNDVARGVDGKLWILTSREKTSTTSNIPLLPKALVVLERYKDFPPCVAKNVILPVLSNQKMNSYLKEIADLYGITKKLTFHMARHTFATTVTLSNGVPIETVSKMLGHTDIKTTQHDAKLPDTKIDFDFGQAGINPGSQRKKRKAVILKVTLEIIQKLSFELCVKDAETLICIAK